MKSAARPAPQETAGVRARALTAAAALLASQGADDISLRNIAETAGIGLASIYHYFESKENLLLSLALAGFADLRRDVVDFQKDPEFASPMRGGARAYFSFVETRPQLFSLMFNERLLARHEDLRAASMEVFAAYLTAVRADDRIPPAHQENAAYALWALGRGMAAIIASYPPGQMPSELTARLFAGASWLINRPE